MLVCVQGEPFVLGGGVVRGVVVGAAGARPDVGAAGGLRGRRVPPQVVDAPAVPEQYPGCRRQVPHTDMVRLHCSATLYSKYKIYQSALM